MGAREDFSRPRCTCLTQLTLSVFLCVYWPVVYVPWGSVYSDLLLISKLGYLFFIVESYGSLYGLDLSPSPEKRFADLFPMLWIVFFTALTVPFEAQKL